MKVYIVVGYNKTFENISARAAYTRIEDALAHLKDPKRMWFDDSATVVELELDRELEPDVARTLIATWEG